MGPRCVAAEPPTTGLLVKKFGNLLLVLETLRLQYGSRYEGLHSQGPRRSCANPSRPVMGDFLFIVSRTKPQRYLRLKHAFADQTEDVVLDRRTGERRQGMRPPPASKGHVDWSRSDISRELDVSGCSLVRRAVDDV